MSDQIFEKMNEEEIKLFITQPNIGKHLAEKLIEAGITTVEELKDQGSEAIFTRLTTIDNTLCINVLYALEGAVQGIRWHSLNPGRKAELLDFFHQIKRGE